MSEGKSEPDCVTYEEYSRVLAENDALRAERDLAKNAVVSGFYEDDIPYYRQGYPVHELESAVTAEEITGLRDQLLAAEAKLAGGVVARDELVERVARALARLSYPSRSLEEAVSQSTKLWQRLIPEAEIAVDALLTAAQGGTK